LGHDHPAPAQPARPAPGRTVALPRSGDALRAAGLRFGLQADHPRTAVVPDPAAADDDHIHGHLRQHRIPAHGWTSAISLLHVWHGSVVVLCRVPHQNQRDLCAERQPVRQSLFPAHGGASLDPDLEPDHLCDSVRAVPGFCVVFHPARHLHPTQLVVDRPVSSPSAHDGWPGTRTRHHHLFADHQIP